MEAVAATMDFNSATTVAGLSILRPWAGTKISAEKSSARSVKCSTRPISVWWIQTRRRWRVAAKPSTKRSSRPKPANPWPNGRRNQTNSGQCCKRPGSLSHLASLRKGAVGVGEVERIHCRPLYPPMKSMIECLVAIVDESSMRLLRKGIFRTARRRRKI